MSRKNIFYLDEISNESIEEIKDDEDYSLFNLEFISYQDFMSLYQGDFKKRFENYFSPEQYPFVCELLHRTNGSFIEYVLINLDTHHIDSVKILLENYNEWKEKISNNELIHYKWSLCLLLYKDITKLKKDQKTAGPNIQFYISGRIKR